MKKLSRILAVSITAAIALALGISGASANAQYGPYDINENGSNFWLHAHSDNGVLTVSSTGFQDWAIVLDTQGNSNRYQIVLQGTHWCANWNSGDNNFYLNGCDGTQLSQQFVFSSTGNAGQVWYISSGCVDGGGGGFMTAFDTSDGSVIDCEGSGQGNRAVWNNVDS